MMGGICMHVQCVCRGGMMGGICMHVQCVCRGGDDGGDMHACTVCV